MNTEKLILGTVQLGMSYGINNSEGKPSFEDAIELLDYAYDAGVRSLDTAEAYGNAQAIIGAFHKKHPDKIFKIITKLSRNDSFSVIREQVEKNLSVLAVSSLNGYMLHNYASLKENPGLYRALIEIRDSKLADKIGISLYTNSEVNDVIQNYEFDYIQIPFNLLDNDNQRGELLCKVKHKNIEVHTRSVFLQGLFFKDIETLPLYLQPLKEELKAIKSLAKVNGLPMEHLAMGYVNGKQYVDKFLIGVDSIEQLKSNFNAFKSELSKNQILQVEEINTTQTHLLNPSNWQ